MVRSSWKQVNALLKEVPRFYGSLKMVKSYWSHKEARCARKRACISRSLWWHHLFGLAAGQTRRYEMHVVTAQSHTGYFWCLLFDVQTKTYVRDIDINTHHFFYKVYWYESDAVYNNNPAAIVPVWAGEANVPAGRRPSVCEKCMAKLLVTAQSSSLL